MVKDVFLCIGLVFGLVILILFKFCIIRVPDGYSGYIIGVGIKKPKIVNPGELVFYIPFFQQYNFFDLTEIEIKIPPNLSNGEKTERKNPKEGIIIDARDFICKDNKSVRIQFYLMVQVDFERIIKMPSYRAMYNSDNKEQIANDAYIIARAEISGAIRMHERHEIMHHPEKWMGNLKRTLEEKMAKRGLIVTDFGEYSKSKHDLITQLETSHLYEKEKLEKKNEILSIQGELKKAEVVTERNVELEKIAAESDIQVAKEVAEIEKKAAISKKSKENVSDIILGIEAEKEIQVAKINSDSEVTLSNKANYLAQQEIEKVRVETEAIRRRKAIEIAKSEIELIASIEETKRKNKVELLSTVGKIIAQVKPDSWNVVGGNDFSPEMMIAGVLKSMEALNKASIISDSAYMKWENLFLNSKYNVDQKCFEFLGKGVEGRTLEINQCSTNEKRRIRQFVNKTVLSGMIDNFDENKIDSYELSDSQIEFAESVFNMATGIFYIFGRDIMEECVKIAVKNFSKSF